MKEISEIKDWLIAHPAVLNISFGIYDGGIKIRINTRTNEHIEQWIPSEEINRIDTSAQQVLHVIYMRMLDDIERKRIRFEYFGE